MENKDILGNNEMENLEPLENNDMNPADNDGVNEIADKAKELGAQAVEKGKEIAGKAGEKVLEKGKELGAQTAEKGKEIAGKAAEKALEKGKELGKKAVGNVAGAAAKVAIPLLTKVIIGVLIIATLGGAGFGIFNFIENSNELKIADTPNVVEKIRKISELTTYTYVEEFVVKDKKMVVSEHGNAISNWLHKDAEVTYDTTYNDLVIIIRGKVRAGYDLSKITENQLKISNDTISVVLPQPEIFDAIINPSDNDFFVEEGKWSHEEITALQVGCREKLLNNAIERGVLERADKVGKEKVENLFKSFGFNVVNVKTSK